MHLHILTCDIARANVAIDESLRIDALVLQDVVVGVDLVAAA